jgi:hypothetical protein
MDDFTGDVRPMPGTHSPRPRRGTMESALNEANHAGVGISEVWVHPADTADLLNGGIEYVNGHRVYVTVVDRLAFADQLRIVVKTDAH